MRAEILRQAFEALTVDHPAEAETALVRYRDFVPDSELPGLVLGRQRERMILQRVDLLLRDARPEEARLLLESELKSGAIPGLGDILITVEALGKLKEYQGSLPFHGSEAMAQALAPFEAPDYLLRTSLAFKKWLGSQRLTLQRTRDREKDLELRRLVKSLDAAVAAGATDIRDQLGQMAGLDPHHALLRLMGTADSLVWGSAVTSAGTGDDVYHPRAGVEIAGWLRRDSLPAADRHRVGELLTDSVPETKSGLLFRAWYELGEGRVANGIDTIRRLTEMPDLDGSAIAPHFLRAALLPPEQFRAACWRSPAPSVADVLSRLLQLHERHFPE